MVQIDELTDEQLRERLRVETEKLKPRAQALLGRVVAGEPAMAAARDLGISTNAAVLRRMRKRIEPAARLSRELVRRASGQTAEGTARWFDSLATEAREAGDYSAARSAKREAALLRGLYPEMRLKLEVETSPALTDEEWLALVALRHSVRAKDVTPALGPVSSEGDKTAFPQKTLESLRHRESERDGLDFDSRAVVEAVVGAEQEARNA